MSLKAKGGITKGKSHAEGGMPMVVKSTGQKVELEGGEGVINKKNMADTQKHEFEGKMLTKCEIASEINSDGGNGVEIDCDGIVGKKYKHQDGGRLAEGGDIKMNEVTRFVPNRMIELRPTESQLTETMKWLSNNNYSNTGKMNERDGSFYIGVYVDKTKDKFVKLVAYLNSKSIKYGWLDDVELKVGEDVGFDVPYFESFLEYRGKIIGDKGSYLQIEYYEPLYNKMNITDVDYDRVYRLSKFDKGGEIPFDIRGEVYVTFKDGREELINVDDDRRFATNESEAEQRWMNTLLEDEDIEDVDGSVTATRVLDYAEGGVISEIDLQRGDEWDVSNQDHKLPNRAIRYNVDKGRYELYNYTNNEVDYSYRELSDLIRNVNNIFNERFSVKLIKPMGKNDSYEFGGLLNMKGVYFNWDVWLVRNEVYTKDILGDGKYKRATYPESKFYVYSKNGAKNLINTFKSKNIKPQVVIDESFMKRIEYKFDLQNGNGYTIVIIEPTKLRKFVDSEDLGTLTNDYFTFERKNYAKGGDVKMDVMSDGSFNYGLLNEKYLKSLTNEKRLSLLTNLSEWGYIVPYKDFIKMSNQEALKKVEKVITEQRDNQIPIYDYMYYDSDKFRDSVERDYELANPNYILYKYEVDKWFERENPQQFLDEGYLNDWQFTNDIRQDYIKIAESPRVVYYVIPYILDENNPKDDGFIDYIAIHKPSQRVGYFDKDYDFNPLQIEKENGVLSFTDFETNYAKGGSTYAEGGDAEKPYEVIANVIYKNGNNEEINLDILASNKKEAREKAFYRLSNGHRIRVGENVKKIDLEINQIDLFAEGGEVRKREKAMSMIDKGEMVNSLPSSARYIKTIKGIGVYYDKVTKSYYFKLENGKFAKGGDIDGFDETWNRFKENTREAFGQPRKNNIVRLESDFGFKKSELPQLRTKDKPMFVKSLISKYGANVVTEGLKVKASQLKPIQNEINLEQVEVISNVSKGKMNPNKPITISQDGYVIDGHHRWYYAKENDLKLSVLQINLNAMEVIDEIWQSGLAKKEDIDSVRKQNGGKI